MITDVDSIYNHFKKERKTKYNEEEHCKLLIKTMLDPNKGKVESFCVEALITDSTFFEWVRKYELFGNVYYFSKMVAKEIWEEEGRAIKNKEYPLGTVNYEFEHWKLMGWSRFGISNKSSRIKININPNDNPAQHYFQVLKQAAEGDFTAGEIKQLMEAVNVGLNTHQVIELQQQIDELKSNLSILSTNTNVQNPFTNKGIAQKD